MKAFMKTGSSWISKNWRPLSFLVYAVICLFDFIVMPSIIEMTNRSIDPSNLTLLALQFKEAATQLELLKLLGSARVWEPLTMGGAGVFHIAFGALLTSASYTRGLERIESMRQNKNVPDEDK